VTLTQIPSKDRRRSGTIEIRKRRNESEDFEAKTSIHAKHFAEMTMIAEDVPLPDDEGLEDEVVSENVEGSSLEEKIERSTMTHRF
jgi:hypothetical protein